MNVIKMKCEYCGADLEVDESRDRIVCKYCGSKLIINDEATRIKRIHEANLKARKENHEQDIKEKIDIKEITEKEKFSTSGFSIVLLTFFGISVLAFFLSSEVLTKILTFCQAGLFITAWLMGMKIIKEKKNGLRVILAIGAFVMIIPIINAWGKSNKFYENYYKKINWDYIVLNEYLPELTDKKGKIIINSDDSLSVYISIKSEDDYRKYVKECKDFGYTVNAKNETNSYEASNGKGYFLNIRYSEYNNEYHILLEKKIEEIENDKIKSHVEKSDESIIKIDYESETDFENALNNGNIEMKGKIVKFKVLEYKPDSFIGINCWAGEHLNFISERDVNAKKDDIIIAKILENPKSSLDSWYIKYEKIEVSENVEDEKIYIDEQKKQEEETKTKAEEEQKKQEEEAKQKAEEEQRKQAEQNIPANNYTTNNKEKYKNGNEGVYSYRTRGGQYYCYYIIDFNEKVVYYFTEGNGDESCMKATIESGNLNDVMIAKFSDGSQTWLEGFHFKYKNQPDHLINEDNNHYTTDLYGTDLSYALKIKKQKRIM